MLNGNTYNDFTVYNQMINIEYIYKYYVVHWKSGEEIYWPF